MSLKILLADDHRMMREGLRALLNDQPDFEVVGEAADGLMAVKLAQELAPDIVVMDIDMPKLDGIDATRRIREALPETKIVALSVHAERPFVYEIIRAGAAAYVVKQSAVEELINAIHAAMDNHVYLSPQVTGTLVDDFIHQSSQQVSAAEGDLSIRELEVLQLLVQGKSTKETAFHLRLSAKTVETHRRQIMKKLDVQSMAELTKYAIRRGLTSL